MNVPVGSIWQARSGDARVQVNAVVGKLVKYEYIGERVATTGNMLVKHFVKDFERVLEAK